MPVAYLAKWLQTIKVSWAQHTAYRLNFFLQVIGPALVFFFIKYNLWNSIYTQNGGAPIKGYDFDGMITYHLWALIVALIAKGHSGLNMAVDIRMGRISSYLIYPFNFWEFHAANFISFELLQILISFTTLGIVFASGLMVPPALESFASGILFCLYISIFWFSIQYFLGLLSFWLEETWILRVIFDMITVFLSGAIIPLDLYPEWAVKILNYTPFPYMTYYPIKIFTGVQGLELQAIGAIGGWFILILFLNHLTWKKGVRLYTAAGM